MFRWLRRLLVLSVLFALLAGCSSTVLSGSWKSPEYQKKIHKVYLVGVAKNETNRRIFEDEFVRQLRAEGVAGISSYIDLRSSANADLQTVRARVAEHGADSVLITRLLASRTESAVIPGRIVGQERGTRYSDSYRRSAGAYYSPPDPYYRDLGSYYDRSFEAIYEPATVTQFQVATIEANLYDAVSSELIWSAQLETTIDSNIQKLTSDFVSTVVKDLRRHGLL